MANQEENQYRKWVSTEFNNELYDIPAFLTEDNGWQDNSWHNDTSPRFHNEHKRLCIWIGDRDKKDSDILYCVQRIDSDGDIIYEGNTDILLTDSLSELISFLEQQPLVQGV